MIVSPVGTFKAEYCPSVSGCRSVIEFEGGLDPQTVDLQYLDINLSFDNKGGKPVWLVGKLVLTTDELTQTLYQGSYLVVRHTCLSLVLCIFLNSSPSSLHFTFSLPIFLCPPTSIFPLLHLRQSFSPHVLTISVSLLLFSLLCLPHLILILFLLS